MGLVELQPSNAAFVTLATSCCPVMKLKTANIFQQFVSLTTDFSTIMKEKKIQILQDLSNICFVVNEVDIIKLTKHL